RVTAAEGVNTSQSSSITSLTNGLAAANTAINLKASASALDALTTTVTGQGNSLTSQGSAITSLQNTLNHPTTGLASRASASALSALDSRVTAAEGVNTSQSSSITSLTNGLGQSGSQNLIYNPAYVVGAGAAAEGWLAGLQTAPGTAAASLVASILGSGRMQRLTLTNVTTVSDARVSTTGARATAVLAGQTYTASAYVRGSNTGLRTQVVIGWVDAVGGSLGFSGGTYLTHTGNWLRVVATALAPANTVSARIFIISRAVSEVAVSGTVDHAQAQLEAGSVATGWRDNGAAQQEVQASALSALDSRVTAAEGVNTSQSSSITSLTNGLAAANTAINLKASASALDALTTTVTGHGNSLTSQGSAITSLQNGLTALTGIVETKASASALSALTNRVSDAEGLITAQGSSLTEVTARIGQIYGQGLWQITTEIVTGGDVTLRAVLWLRATVGDVWAQNGTVWEAGFRGGDPSKPFSRTIFMADQLVISGGSTGKRSEFVDGVWRYYDANGTMRVKIGD
ncbi:MAG: hypothetical protein QM645_11325, partial [Asticcacaulis sp.]